MKKRLGRVALPFVGWLVVYKIWEFGASGRLFTASEFAKFLKRSVISFLQGNPFFHLYFFLIISGLYFAAPVMRFFIYRVSMQIRLLFMAGFFLIPCVSGIYYAIFAVDRLTPLCGVPYNCTTIWLPFAGYFIAGSCLGEIRITKPVCAVRRAFFCFIIAGGCTAAGTFFLFTHYGVNSRGLFFYNYLSPFVIVMSVSVFIIIRCLHGNIFHRKFYNKLSAGQIEDSVICCYAGHDRNRTVRFIAVVRSIASLTFGVFLVHPFIMFLLDMAGVNVDTAGANLFSGSVFAGLPCIVLIVLVCSFMSVYVIKKIPVAEKFV